METPSSAGASESSGLAPPESMRLELTMLPTYPAVLRAGLLKWEADSPPDDTVRVHVTVLAPYAPSLISGQSMADALTALAAVGGPSGFDDPSAWQRETRTDRLLPGRTD